MGETWIKTMQKNLNSYFQNTTIHGCKYLVQTKRPLIEKFIWLIIISINFLMTFYIFNLMLDDYNNKATITTLENAKYPITEVPFPAIAVCNVNRISKHQVMIKSKEIALKVNMSEDVVAKLMRNIGKLYDFEMDNLEEMNKLQNIFEKYYNGLEDFNEMMNLLYEISPNCDDTMVKCLWLGIERNCSEIFSSRRTMDGYCCTFNYVKSWEGFNFSKDRKYLLYSNAAMNHSEKYYFSGAGIDMGLSVVVYSNPDDYFYPLTSTQGFSVKIFNSHDYPDISSGALTEIYIPINYETYMQLTAITIKALDSLSTLPIEKRGCVFENEGSTAFDTTFYSYSDCLSDCKLKSILAICECIPFYFPVLNLYSFSRQICGISDIPCLDKHKDQWRTIYPKLSIEELNAERENSIYCPKCLPSCSSTSYKVYTDSAALVDVGNDLLKGLNLSVHSIIHIYSDTEDTMLYKSDISYYWFDIISNFGGTFSLFLGVSIISAVEFVYFCTIRYIRLLNIQRRNK